jgi:hypothetical protein
MLDLFSIEEFKPIKEGIRCHTCLKFNVILHASDIWVVEDDNFVKLAIPKVDGCFLIDRIFSGSLLREEDYEIIDACESYEECEEWVGINKTSVAIINALIEYLLLTENKKLVRKPLLDILRTLSEKDVVGVPVEMEMSNKDIREQFLIESKNYSIMEAVRRKIHDT